MHKISEAAHSALDLPDLFARIHEIIGELMNARNLYVALYDPASDLISFPYFIDEFDSRPEPRIFSSDQGLTAIVLRTGEPLLLTPESSKPLIPDPGQQYTGTEGIDWLGVPLKTARGIIGVLTVQTYSGLERYSDKDKQLLRFVSDQVAAAIERTRTQQALRESEELFRSVFDKSPIAIAVLSFPEGRFEEMNPAGVDAFGYSREEALGRTSAELGAWVNPEDRRTYLEQLLSEGSVENFETVMRRRNGEIFNVLSSASLITRAGKTYTLNSLQDITERKRAERWQRHYADSLRLISADAPTSIVLESLVRFVEHRSAGILCSILLLSPDGKRLHAGSGPSLPAFYNEAIDGTEVSETAGSCGAAAATGKIVIVEDIMIHPNWSLWRELAASAGLRSCWSHPILSAENSVLGTFATYRREPSYPGKDELDLIEQSADLAAIALERAQHNQDQRLAKVVFEQSIEGIMVTDPQNRVVMVNQSFEKLTGYSAPEVVGMPSQILDLQQDDPAARKGRSEALGGAGRWSGEVWGRKKTGEIYPMAMSVSVVKDPSRKPSHYISVFADISDQKLQAARIEQLAFYDLLTGLPNRALFLDRLEQTLNASKRHGGHGAILFVDLDRFKEINDSQGHAVGDLALAEVARRFKTAARKEETLARLGGDEFVLMAENADVEAAVLIAMRLLASLADPLELLGNAYSVGASIGIAFYPADGETSEDLIKRTDIAMYRAKVGGGGYRLYKAEMGSQLDKRLAIAKHLRKAIGEGELELYYQPQIDLGTGHFIGAEALLRWNHPALGWISPADFIPIAEERGMMGPLGDWVLREACRQINEWAAKGTQLPGKLAINISAQQIEHADIVARLLGILHESNLSPSQFELELTESAMMVDAERCVQIMRLLRAAGFGLSIDDFGTGYSSFSYLKRFAADHVKIDISFVQNMLTDSNDYTIVTTIIAMARSLGLKTTAEGVEYPGQADALRSLGCDSAQGYFFGRPEPPDAFAARWLKIPPHFVDPASTPP